MWDNKSHMGNLASSGDRNAYNGALIAISISHRGSSMKSIDPPISIPSTLAAANEDTDPTELLPVVQPDINMLVTTETLRVLEVLRPTRGMETLETTDSYAVDIEERVDRERPALTLVPSPRAAPAPTVKAPTPRSAPSPGHALADQLKALSRNSVEAELEDLSRTTGVRHLRIEIQKRAKSPVKPSGGRKR